jgi:hypothetical protein
MPAEINRRGQREGAGLGPSEMNRMGQRGCSEDPSDIRPSNSNSIDAVSLFGSFAILAKSIFVESFVIAAPLM